MNFIETIVLGLVQGMTEFIPVSSSGHLVLMQNWFSGNSSHLFLEFVNIGTTLALVVYFRKRLVSILHDVLVNKNMRLARNVVLTSIPAGLIGFLLSDYIGDSSFFGSAVVVAAALAVVGLIMILLERLPKGQPIESGEQLSAGQALTIGFAQTAALVPGVSRSGSTIIAGRLTGLNPEKSAEYSFLASIPIMLAVTAKVFLAHDDRAYFVDNMPMLLLSNAVAFLAGVFAIGFLLRYLSRHSLAVFGWYRLGLAAIVTVVLLIQ